MDQALAAYLPMDRRHALAMGTPLPERALGAVLFADISGFTPLTEVLTQELGARRGAEELPRQLNLVYDALIAEVDRYGGSVIGFAGDAITCWFDRDSALRATACALALQQAMQPFAALPLPSGGTAALAMKVAVAAGTVGRFLVGDPEIQLIDTLAGATLIRMAAAEQIAEKGEVVLDEVTAQALAGALAIQEWRSDEHGARFAVVRALHEVVAPQPWGPLPPDSLGAGDLRPWLLPTVYERLHAGQGEFLTELRPAVALFLRFGGIDYDADPEAGRKLDAYVRWVQSTLGAYEGSLLQLTIGEKGSYLYAAFGAPIAHEDDAHRAVLTALALHTPPEELSFITEVQMGLTRGTMRTGAYGGSTRRTYGSLGDDVNLAARLMQHAQPGEIIASGRVQTATASLFVWQALSPLQVKGKSELIPVFALQGQVQERSTIHLMEPTYTLPMIGRVVELARLGEKMGLARQGRGQVVGITGEAGMGKSRLVAEAIRLAQAQGLMGYGGECQSYGINTPYLVWQPIWRAFFGLESTSSPTEQYEHLARLVAELSPSLLPRLPLLAPVLGLPLEDNELTGSLSPELRKASLEALLIDLLKARARRLGVVRRAMLLVLEDCQWLDAASHDLLEAMGHAIWNLPVLVLMVYRPPDIERLMVPRLAALPYFMLLSLTELNEEETVELIATRLARLNPQDARHLPEALLVHLASRAQGNPFYLEELLNYLHDQGLDPYDEQVLVQLELPTSLHSLILSRIDRLTEPQQVTLKVASIIGRLFRLAWLRGYYPTLGDVPEVRRNLDALDRLNLTPLEQPEPELAYLFKHIITREVAYESLPFMTRAHLHEQLALFLEAQEATAVEGYLDLLAYHYVHSENRVKTREYLRRAGEAAQAAYANSAAQAYYEQLLPLLEEVSEQVEIRLRLGKVLERVGEWENAEMQYQVALEVAPLVSAAVQARGTQALGRLYERRGQYEQAQSWLLQALSQWEAVGDQEGVSQTMSELGFVAYRQADFERARTYLEQSQTACRARGDRRGLANALIGLGNVMSGLAGSYEAAQALYEECMALQRELGDKQGVASALIGLANLEVHRGNYQGAELLFEESLALCREIGYKQASATSLYDLGLVVYFQGRYEAAQALYEESLNICREMGAKGGMAWSLFGLGLVANAQGQYVVAQSLHEESLALRREMGAKRGIVFSLWTLGEVVFNRGNYESARAMYEESLSLCRETGDKRGMADALSGLGAVTYALGQADAAQPFYDESLTLNREMGNKRGIANALRGLGTVAWTQEEDTRALGLYEESLALNREMGNKREIIWNLNLLGATRYRQGDTDGARRDYRESLTIAHSIGEKKQVVAALLGLAALAAQQGTPESLHRAIRLLAVAETLRVVMDLHLAPVEQAMADAALAAAHAAVSEATFDLAWAEGARLALAEAVTLALEGIKPSTAL